LLEGLAETLISSGPREAADEQLLAHALSLSLPRRQRSAGDRDVAAGQGRLRTCGPDRPLCCASLRGGCPDVVFAVGDR
jgi:hypothetical protein